MEPTTYTDAHAQARKRAQDFLAANPRAHMAIISHAGVRLTMDASGNERVSHPIEADAARKEAA